MPKGIALTEDDLKKRRYEIFKACQDTFLKKGFLETSMQEIADLAGMGKSSLYDYFKTKDGIMVFMMEEALNNILSKAKAILARKEPADKSLRAIMEVHLAFIVENKDLFALFSIEGRRLGLESQKQVQKGRYAYQDMLRSMIEAGIQEGTFREVEPLLAARLLINTLIPVVYSSRPTGTPREMLEETLDIILNGIQA